MLFAILCISIAGFLFLFIYIRYRQIFTIKALTLHMQEPEKNAGQNYRKTASGEAAHNTFVAFESQLRRSAYRNSLIRTGENFFDDSDMQGDYYLIVVYDKKKNIPLLSARYYFNQEVIGAYLAGDNKQLSTPENTIDLQKFSTDELFLSDRLSGNISSAAYRHHRSYIFLLFYIQVLKRNRGKKFILMARREKQEKLLTKYLRLGLNISGKTTLRGKEHWILFGDVESILNSLKASVPGNFLILFKTVFSSRNT